MTRGAIHSYRPCMRHDAMIYRVGPYSCHSPESTASPAGWTAPSVRQLHEQRVARIPTFAFMLFARGPSRPATGKRDALRARMKHTYMPRLGDLEIWLQSSVPAVRRPQISVELWKKHKARRHIYSRYVLNSVSRPPSSQRQAAASLSAPMSQRAASQPQAAAHTATHKATAQPTRQIPLQPP